MWNKRIFSYLLIIASVVYISGCSPSELPPAKYIKWVESTHNGLRLNKTVGNYSFVLQYAPHEYLALRQENPDSVKKERIDSHLEELEGFYYLNLRMSGSDGRTSVLSMDIASEEEYYYRLNYFVSQAQQDIVLVEGTDSLPCALYLFERTYDTSPYNTLVMGFKKKTQEKLHDNLTFIFREQILGVGTLKFEIAKKNIYNVPKLTI
jgi:hypothetical protein